MISVDHDLDRVSLFSITDNESNERVDSFLAFRIKGLTRSRIQGLIKNGFVKVNERSPKMSYRLKTGDTISLRIPPVAAYHLEPEPVDFTVVHEDSSLIVLNKPAGIVVHPAPGHPKGTLVQGLLQYSKNLSGIGGVLRPGIVHRLDKDTSGLLVVAKNDHAHNSLTKQFKEGTVSKCYVALVFGVVSKVNGYVDLPIARNPKRRKEMTVLPSKGKEALTYWEKREELANCFSLMAVKPKTGRTHQIRVHLSYLGHPIVGDQVYGYTKRWWKRYPSQFGNIMPLIKRQMLHSESIGFIHPQTKEFCKFDASMPEDMRTVIERLRLLQKGSFKFN